MSLDSEFKPRKEFHRTDSVRHEFALLALSGNSCLRLYSFPQSVISHLRRLLLDGIGIASFREDPAQNFYEITVDGKPWGSPKAVRTESLLVSILSVIYQCNYSFLSLIDYGREHDDRIAIAFSVPTSRSFQPSPNAGKLLPFAISFPSDTLLRVISPPLDSTPAILQAVRGAWPRGVVSEKKIGDDVFEFKLKGYRWFQEDTFAADSLRHILTLLSSLDAHSFTLLASVSLTNTRSRVKDLWVFTGPAPSSGQSRATGDSFLTTSPNPTLSPTLHNVYPSPHGSPRLPSHRKLASEPIPNSPPFMEAGSERLAKDTDTLHQANIIRKPAPRARIPVSVSMDDTDDGYPTVLPSVISEGTEKTSIGMKEPPTEVSRAAASRSPTPCMERDLPRPQDNGKPTESPHPPLISLPPPTDVPVSSGQPTPSTIREILSPDAFRDSTLTSNSEVSQEIPIEWAGSTPEPPKFAHPPPPVRGQSDASIPQIPGGWQPTPVDEKTVSAVIPEAPAEESLENDVSHREAGAVARIPEVRQESTIRKSEAGVIGGVEEAMHPPTEPVPDLPHTAKQSAGTGWVMVNVEGQAGKVVTEGSTAGHAKADSSGSGQPQGTQTPEYKDVLVEDALNNSKPSLSKKDGPAGSSKAPPLSSKKESSDTAGSSQMDDEGSTGTSDDTSSSSTPPKGADRAKPAKKAKLGLRQRLKLLGTPEASRHEDKRRNID